MDSVTPGIGDRGSGIGKDRGDRPARPWSRPAADAGAECKTTADPPEVSPDPRSPRPDPPESVSDLREFIRAEINWAGGELRDALALAGQLQEGTRPVVCNEHRLVNALLSDWIARGLVLRAEVNTPDGKRDPRRAADVLLGMYREMKADVERDVRDLVASYRDDAFRAYGLEAPPAPAPGDRDEAQATADDSGSDE